MDVNIQSERRFYKSWKSVSVGLPRNTSPFVGWRLSKAVLTVQLERTPHRNFINRQKTWGDLCLKFSLTSMTLLPDSYSNYLSPRAVQPYKEKGTAFMITFIPLHDLVPHVGCQDLRLWGSTPVRIIVRSTVLCVLWRQRAAPAPPWGDVGSPSIYTSLPLPPKRHKFGPDHLHLYLPRWEISTMPTILSLTTLLLSTKKGTSTLPMSVATPGLEQVGIQLETTPVSANNCNIGRHYWRKMSPQATLGVRPSWGNPSHRITNIREKDEAYPSQQKPGRECSQILGL